MPLECDTKEQHSAIFRHPCNDQICSAKRSAREIPVEIHDLAKFQLKFGITAANGLLERSRSSAVESTACAFPNHLGHSKRCSPSNQTTERHKFYENV
ncbi:hypothetical protein L1887_60568 [Cichorium endivia]|nr:hypothetical protein L1887_60568 [Cichorium endivia]